MTHLRIAAALACSTLLAACTDYATFVTSTDVGINANTATETVNLGYVRTELFTGPAYPDKGSAPSTIGYVHSDLSPLSPQIKQVYATGTAAELVTQHDSPGTAAADAETLDGPRRPFVFGTGTNFGLKATFAGNAPSSIKFGYNREELSIIPLHQTAASGTAPTQADKYASVLASIDLESPDSTTPAVTTATGTKIGLTQFFATGAAAQNLAKRDDIRQIIGNQATEAVAASLDATVQQSLALQKSDLATISAYFDKFPNDFASARKKLVDAAGLTNMPVVGAALNSAPDKSTFLSYLQKNETLIPRVASSVAKVSA